MSGPKPIDRVLAQVPMPEAKAETYEECAERMTALGFEPISREAWDRFAEVERAQVAEETAEKERAEKELHETCARAVAWGIPVKDAERIARGDLEVTTALNHCRAFRGSAKTLLVLCGGEGCGKTTAAAWWLMQPKQGHRYLEVKPPKFVTAGQLSLWPRFDRDARAELDLARCLVIDDVGLEYDDTKGAFRGLFREVTHERHNKSLPTVITTNIPGHVFSRSRVETRYQRARDFFGDPFRGRLRQSGTLANIKDSSMRGAK